MSPTEITRVASAPGEGMPSGAPIQMYRSWAPGFGCHIGPSHTPSIATTAVIGAISRSSRAGNRDASAPTPRPKNAEMRTRLEK